SVAPNSQVRDVTSFGILKLTLHATSYDWVFLPTAGGTFTDSGTGACHTASPDTEAPSAPAALTATATSATRVDLTWTPSTDNVAVTGYHVYRNNTLIATTTGPAFGDTTTTRSTTYR